jgi:subtilisin family serine protease
MAQSWYQITAAPDKLARIAAQAREAAGSRDGDPVLAIGSHRIVLLPVAVRAMLEKAAAQAGNGKPRVLEDIIKGVKAVNEISPARVAELMAAREPEELAAVPRLAPDNNDLVIDGRDWHVKRTRLVEAWDLLGDPDRIDWKDIRVGQIDTGYRPHPCLGFDAAGRSAFVLTDFDRNLFDVPGGVEPDPITGIGRPLGSEDSALDPLLGGPNDGHGTRTGSVLAGRDADKNYFGAAPRVPYIPVRISNSVIINNVQQGLARAIDHLVQHGCSVITLSMGMAFTFIRNEVRDAIDRAYDQGVILVTAAGNIWDPVVAPARLNRTLAIGGCTPSFTPWAGSSFGPEVDICAPAWPIRRASVDRKGKPTYGHGDGTSFATPLVAGTAALWLLHHREAIRNTYRKKWQWVEAFKHILTSTAQPGVDWDQRLYGAGILDAHAVLQAQLPHPDSLEEDRRA